MPESPTYETESKVDMAKLREAAQKVSIPDKLLSARVYA